MIRPREKNEPQWATYICFENLKFYSRIKIKRNFFDFPNKMILTLQK